jgi:hypothetical protein
MQIACSHHFKGCQSLDLPDMLTELFLSCEHPLILLAVSISFILQFSFGHTR